MALDPASVRSDSSQLEAYGFYFALTRSAPVPAAIDSGGEPNLGGTLVYVGELDAHGRALAIAGNVAGCATLAATADVAAQRQSIRDGVVDFLVTSLDEALRILKNEIRQRKTVAVAVSVAPGIVEREMHERGVQPHLVFAGLPGQQRNVQDFGMGSCKIQLTEPDPGLASLTWEVAHSPARWMPKLDAVVVECFASDSWERRWFRLSPRYLGRTALAQRALFCDPQVAKEIVSRIADLVRGGEIGAEVSASLVIGGDSTVFRILPSATRERNS